MGRGMTGDFTLRTARLEDKAAVTALLKASYPVLMAPSYDTETLPEALRLMTRAQPRLLRSGSFYVAEPADGSTAGQNIADRNIIGCGGWSRESPVTGKATGTLGHIRHFGTHPDWTGRGVGRAIFDLCAAQARDAGITEFECCSSLNAEGFYARLGFTAVGRMDFPLRRHRVFPGVLMRRGIGEA